MAKDLNNIAADCSWCTPSNNHLIIPTIIEGKRDEVHDVMWAPCAQECKWQGTAPAPKWNIDAPSQ